MCTIIMDNIIFKIIFEYISRIDVYATTEYTAPNRLASISLMFFILLFNIVPVAYKIM